MNESPNNLRSKQYARIIDVLSEGPIKGVVGGMKGVYLDGTQLQRADGSMSYANSRFQFVNGLPNQPIMDGFASQEQEENVSLEMKYNIPVVRSIPNTDVDRCRITVSVPSLSNTDTNSGDIEGDFVNYRIERAPDGKPFEKVGDFKIEGKTMSRYQREHVFPLTGIGPWQIRVTRTSVEPLGTDRQCDLFWDSFTAIIDDRVNFNSVAVVGIQIDAEQFATIPKRVYLVDGLRVLVPSNYDPMKATYAGVWDGLWKPSLEWTNNPAFVLNDMVLNNRYGLGAFVPPEMMDKWSIYKVAQFCDQLVPDGKGSAQRRFTCNVQITTQQEAFNLLAQLCSIFRGSAYWAGGMMKAFADQPTSISKQFTTSNVVEGTFTYEGADIRARHTIVSTAFSDPKNLGETRFQVAENREDISRWGIQRLDDPGFAITIEGQALRNSKWILYTEQHETETIAFKSGLEGAYVEPGHVIQVMDVGVAGKRRGGRIAPESTASHIVFDAPIDMTGITTMERYIWAYTGDGTIEMREIGTLSALYADPATPFSAAPVKGSTFIIVIADQLEPTLWRVMGLKMNDDHTYDISGLRHHPDKWNVVERGLAFDEPDISDIVSRPPPPTNLAAREYMVQTSPISVGVRMVISWISRMTNFEVWYRKQPNNNWSTLRTTGLAVDVPVVEGTYDIMVHAISPIGLKSVAATFQYTVIGRYAPPAPPKQFRIKIADSVALFEWLPATELDVIIGGHYELRHSSKTSGATWATAQMVIPSIPGTATSVEAVYRAGTWFLRTYDIAGIASTTAAIVIASQPDGNYTPFARICEDPDWLGSRVYTEVLDPQRWLVLGQTGGQWDEQLANMDTWPDVDVLVEGSPPTPQSEARLGWYDFDHRVDAGGVFAVRFTTEITAFPYQEGSEFIDDRLDNADDWDDWDNVDADLNGQVALYIRTTEQDPALPSANWTEWLPYAPQEYTARGFEFRAVLMAPIGQNIAVEQLCVTADLRMKQDSGEDRPYPAAITHVNFVVKFYLVPSVVVTVQNALETDRIQVLNKTREGFDLSVTNAAGVHQTRTFDWQARGF